MSSHLNSNVIGITRARLSKAFFQEVTLKKMIKDNSFETFTSFSEKLIH